MSRKGGYMILDFKDVAITSGTPVTIPGVFAALEGSYRKPVILSGLNVDGTAYQDLHVNPVIASDDYVIDLSGIGLVSCTITDEDAVTVVAESD